jgi:small GTP-binding protein
VVENTMEFFIKVVMLGEVAVGKTALTQRFIQNQFGSIYKATMGLDISVKEVQVQNNLVRLQVWDLGGRMQFSFLRKFYQGAQGALLIFDLTRPKTLKMLHQWINEIIMAIGLRPIMVIGNKTDIEGFQIPRVEIEEEIRRIEEKLGVYYAGYYQTSAKTGTQVEIAFKDLVKLIFKQILAETHFQSLYQESDDFSDLIEVPRPPDLTKPIQ